MELYFLQIQSFNRLHAPRSEFGIKSQKSLWNTHKKPSFQKVGVATFTIQEKTVFLLSH